MPGVPAVRIRRRSSGTPGIAESSHSQSDVRVANRSRTDTSGHERTAKAACRPADTCNSGVLMRTDSLIALKIGHDTPASLAASLLPVLDRAAGVIGEVLQTMETEASRRELTFRLDGFRTALGGRSDIGT